MAAHDDAIRLEFTLGEDDFLAFAQWYYRNTAEGRAGMRRMLPIAVGLLAIFAWMERDHPEYGLHNPTLYALYIAITGACIAGCYWFYVYIMRPFLIRGVVRTTAFKEMLGDTSLLIDPERITIQNDHGTGRMPWSAVEQIGEDDTNLYLLTGPMRALIIPKPALGDDSDVRAIIGNWLERGKR